MGLGVSENIYNLANKLHSNADVFVQKKVSIQGNAHGGHDLTIHGITDGTTYHASRYGNPNSPNVVLSLHGLYPFREGFHKQYTDHASLEHTQHRVVDMLPHLPGNMPSFSKYTLENYMEVGMTYLAGFIMWLRDYTGVENILLEGVSKGGYDALWYGALFPEHIQKVLLISPLGLQGTIMGQNTSHDTIAALLDSDASRFIDLAAQLCGVKDTNLDDVSKQIVAHDVQIVADTRKETHHLRRGLRRLDNQTTEDILSILVANQMPVALAASRDDPFTQRPGIQRFVDALQLPPQNFFTCENGGHALHMAESTYQDYNAWRCGQVCVSD